MTTKNQKDILSELGELAFASRMKRLSERLMQDVSRIYKGLDFDFEARWFAALQALVKKSPMTVTELARSLRVTHTAVNQMAAQMIRRGFLTSSKGKEDERRRLLALTPKARRIAAELAPVWLEIRSATEELIESAGGSILSEMTRIEEELDRLDMFERVWIRLKGGPPADIVIREYSPALKKWFESLNREWIETYFEVEEYDRKILTDPRGKIVNRGGTVLFAFLDKTVVGTCALVRHKSGALELSKMAVAPKYRGRGIGRRLLEAAVDKSGNMGAAVLYLRTSERLSTANRLYESFGFRRVAENPFDPNGYRRPTFVMRFDLGVPWEKT